LTLRGLHTATTSSPPRNWNSQPFTPKTTTANCRSITLEPPNLISTPKEKSLETEKKRGKKGSLFGENKGAILSTFSRETRRIGNEASLLYELHQTAQSWARERRKTQTKLEKIDV
ncbi:hypothetical protein V8G54_022447, partial [Vigna mungo]